MTKQEKIQEAYGKYWKTHKEYVNEDGWINQSILSRSDFSNLQFNDKFNSMRPLDLMGIENNNGWIKIESEEDLPKDNYGMYHVMAKEDLFCDEPKNQGIDEYWLNDNNKSKNWIKDFSHYQIITKPQQPIY